MRSRLIKNCIATQGGHTNTCEKVEGGFEPEKVLQYIEIAETSGYYGHQLYPSLTTSTSSFSIVVLMMFENISVWLVFSIEKSLRIPARNLQSMI